MVEMVTKQVHLSKSSQERPVSVNLRAGRVSGADGADGRSVVRQLSWIHLYFCNSAEPRLRNGPES